jgi:hypothetical protein
MMKILCHRLTIMRRLTIMFSNSKEKVEFLPLIISFDKPQIITNLKKIGTAPFRPWYLEYQLKWQHRMDSAYGSHQTKGAIPPYFPKGSSQGLKHFEIFISGIYFVYYKPL